MSNAHIVTMEEEIRQFQAAFDARDFDKAAGIFIEAIDKKPESAFRQFFVYGSGQLAEACNKANLTLDIAQRLDKLFYQHPHINFICNDNPETLKRVARIREGNLDKGLPSMVLVSQGKSGSMTVGNIFNSGYRLPSLGYCFSHWKIIDSWARDYARGGACHWTHLAPDRTQIQRLKDAGITKIIVHVRDPRQTLVSAVHHLERYPEQMVEMRESASAGKSVGEKALAVMPYYTETLRWLEGWLDMESEIAILFSTFEMMVTDWDRFLDRYIAFYGGYTKHFSKSNAENRHEGLDYHFRSGRIDEWREVFSPDEAQHLSLMMPERLKERFDWPE